ncbi:MAG: IS630 family transposase [Candidatus Poribacteria bacterium]
MVYVKDISVDEIELLKNHYRIGQCALVRERAHAIILSSQKRNANDIAAILMRSENTVRQWLHDFQQRRISSIFHQYENNINASKLTKEQKQEIKEILEQPPSEQGLSKQFWDVPTLKKYMKAEFGIIYESDRSYHYLLRFCGLSFKLPTVFDKRRNTDQINQRLKEITEEIKPYFTDDEFEIFTADETRLTWEAEIRRAWLKRNSKTILKVHRDNQYQSFFGVLNLKNQKTHTFQLNWQNQQTIIEALRNLINFYPNKKICIIWDNAGWHKGKELRKELSKGQSLEHVHLINFPPYAPDVNPQELVWKYAKDQISNDNVADTFQQTIESFQQSICSATFDYKIPEFVLR